METVTLIFTGLDSLITHALAVLRLAPWWVWVILALLLPRR
jgi:hypothetical protein